jgi:hypothetical protein
VTTVWCICVCTHILVHTHIPTYIHTHMHTYIHVYITHLPTYIHKYIHTHIHIYIHACMNAYAYILLIFWTVTCVNIVSSDNEWNRNKNASPWLTESLIRFQYKQSMDNTTSDKNRNISRSLSNTQRAFRNFAYRVIRMKLKHIVSPM